MKSSSLGSFLTGSEIVSSDSSSDSEDDASGLTDEKPLDARDFEEDFNAVAEIEGDFESVLLVFSNMWYAHWDISRLVRGLRERNNASNSATLNREWDFEINAQDATFRDDLRAASGVGRSRKRVQYFSIYLGLTTNLYMVRLRGVVLDLYYHSKCAL